MKIDSSAFRLIMTVKPSEWKKSEPTSRRSSHRRDICKDELPSVQFVDGTACWRDICKPIKVNDDTIIAKVIKSIVMDAKTSWFWVFSSTKNAPQGPPYSLIFECKMDHSKDLTNLVTIWTCPACDVLGLDPCLESGGVLQELYVHVRVSLLLKTIHCCLKSA